MKNKTICSLTTALIITTSSAFGAVKEGSYSLSPLLGGYVFADSQQFNATQVVGVRGGYSITRGLGIEALYDYVMPTRSKFWELKDVSMQRFGAQALYHFIPDNQLVPYLAAGVSGVKFSGSGVNPDTHISFDYGAGAKYFVTEEIAVRADLRHLLYGYNSTSYNNVELMFGATLHLGGITTTVKPVATVAASKPEPAKPASASEPEKTASAQSTPSEIIACAPPSTIALPPDEATVTIDAPAAKVVSETPQTVALAEAAPVKVTHTCSAPPETTVMFAYEKADVKQKFYDELDTIGVFLKNNELAKVSIEGHTSAMGDKVANLKLSQERADNVKSHLMYKFGIDGGRITTKGYGLTRPAASNKTTAGRMQNRRIVALYSCE